MNNVSVEIDARTRAELQEALREVHLGAGLNDAEEFAPRSLVLGVTSPDFGDGKTTIAIALASSLAEDFGVEVTLADADFHTQSIGRAYGLEREDGLAEAVAGSTRLEDVRHRVHSASMTVIPGGRAPRDPARLARSEDLAALVENMKANSRFVVLDLPATLHSMSAPVLARRCDAVIVVVRAGHTSRQALERTLQLLRDAHVAGVVLNRRSSSVPQWAEAALALRPWKSA